MVTSNVVDLGVLNEAPDLGLLQVVKVVVVSGTEVSAETAVVAGDDNTTAAGGLLLVDTVLDTETSGLDGIVQDSSVLVITDTTEVDDAVVRQDVLGTTGGVLSGTTSNQLSLEIGEEVFVERLVVVLSEDGIVGLEIILGKQLVVTDSLDVWDKLSVAVWPEPCLRTPR